MRDTRLNIRRRAMAAATVALGGIAIGFGVHGSVPMTPGQAAGAEARPAVASWGVGNGVASWGVGNG